MKRLYLAFALLLPTCYHLHAELYKSLDADGHITYSNLDSKGAKKVYLYLDNPTKAEASTPKGKASKKSSPSWFPRVDYRTQKQRDSKRADILNTELSLEQESLAKVKQDYQDIKKAESNYNSSKVKTSQGLTKHEERIRQLEAEIATHERNISLLNKELSH